jgi:hypothetical protein
LLPSKDPLSPLISLSITFHTNERDHDVEPSGGRSSLTTRLIDHPTPLLLSPHRWPSPRRLPRKNAACLCPPLTMEVPNVSQQPLAAPCTLSRGYPSSIALPINHRRPPATYFPLDLMSWHPSLHRRGPTPSTDPSATLCTSR